MKHALKDFLIATFGMIAITHTFVSMVLMQAVLKVSSSGPEISFTDFYYFASPVISVAIMGILATVTLYLTRAKQK